MELNWYVFIGIGGANEITRSAENSLCFDSICIVYSPQSLLGMSDLLHLHWAFIWIPGGLLNQPFALSGDFGIAIV